MSPLQSSEPECRRSRLEACSTMAIGSLWGRHLACPSEIYGRREAFDGISYSQRDLPLDGSGSGFPREAVMTTGLTVINAENGDPSESRRRRDGMRLHSVPKTRRVIQWVVGGGDPRHRRPVQSLGHPAPRGPVAVGLPPARGRGLPAHRRHDGAPPSAPNRQYRPDPPRRARHLHRDLPDVGGRGQVFLLARLPGGSDLGTSRAPGHPGHGPYPDAAEMAGYPSARAQISAAGFLRLGDLVGDGPGCHRELPGKPLRQDRRRQDVALLCPAVAAHHRGHGCAHRRVDLCPGSMVPLSLPLRRAGGSARDSRSPQGHPR